MKKIKMFMLSVLVIFFSVKAFSQTETDGREGLRLGFKAGINYSNVYDEQSDDYTASPKLGFAGGGFLTIPLGSFLAVQPEAMFSQKGYEATADIDGDTYKYTRTTSYLDIPIMLQLRPVESLSLMAGPYYSFLMIRNERFTSENFTIEDEEQIENENIRRNILGVIGGLDVNLDQIVFSGRVGWDLQQNNGDGTSSSLRYKNVFYQLTAGFRF